MTVIFARGEPLVEFPAEDVTISVPLTPVGDRLYRLDGVPILAESAVFGDIIEAEPVDNGRLRFVRVVQSGGWRTFGFIASAHKIDGEWGQSLLRELEALGGYWERVMDGLLHVCIPPGLDLDPTPWVETADPGAAALGP
jgi:hypothetical protein